MPFRTRGYTCAGLTGVLAVALCGALVGCSRPAPEDVEQTDSPVIGGKLDTTDKGVVSLMKAVPGKPGYFYPACSGTLLAQNVVLTAHHCVAALSSGDSESVDCATTQFQSLDAASDMLISIEANVGTDHLDPFPVSQVWVPPGDNSVCGRDIAILMLAGGGIPASAATPIAPALTDPLTPKEAFTAIGYGLQSATDTTGQTVGHRMESTAASVYCTGGSCWPAGMKDGEFIASSPICSGDSGGPALDKNGQVSGITSRGDQDCTIAIYTSVAAWSDFIVNKTVEAAQSGHYTPPAWADNPTAPVTPSAGSSSGGMSGAVGGSGSVSVGGGIAVGGSSATSPTIDPLGLSCTGQCPGSYKCWAATSQPPGICVPACSAQDTTCPSGYTCDTGLAACTKPKTTTTVKSGCSVSAPAAPTAPRDAWLGLSLLGLAWFGRRARRREIGT